MRFVADTQRLGERLHRRRARRAPERSPSTRPGFAEEAQEEAPGAEAAVPEALEREEPARRNTAEPELKPARRRAAEARGGRGRKKKAETVAVEAEQQAAPRRGADGRRPSRWRSRIPGGSSRSARASDRRPASSRRRLGHFPGRHQGDPRLGRGARADGRGRRGRPGRRGLSGATVPSLDRGNIYKGVVDNVLPGMEASFVDVGLDATPSTWTRSSSPSSRASATASESRSSSHAGRRSLSRQ